MILAWKPCSSGELRCYTFGSKYRDCADVKISREVARICRQRHETISVDGEFLSQFPVLAEKSVYISDGAMDVTGSVDLYVQGIARRIAPVRMTGTGGGEILRSLLVFKPGSRGQELLEPELARLTREAATTYATELLGHRRSFAVVKQAPWFLGSKFVLERSQIMLRMPYFDNDVVALAYQAPPDDAATSDLALRLCADGNPALRSIPTDRGLALRSIPGLNGARHLAQEFGFRAEYAYGYGMPQWLARFDHALAPLHLERLFLGRHKIDHFRVWYRDELSAYVKDILLDPRTLSRPYLARTCLEEAVTRHIKGNRNYTAEIHKLVATELVQRQFIEQK
jgi:asparagine synthase (glutamine-hydrolysing)